LGIEFGYRLHKVYTGLKRFGSDAEEAEALVCKTSLSGFESRRYLHALIQKKRSSALSYFTYKPRFQQPATNKPVPFRFRMIPATFTVARYAK
jgi:hypothetical protein